jgi:hydrogenase maturation factor
MNKSFYPVGKLPQDVLARMLQRHAGTDDRIVVGPGIGEDATVIDFADRYLVVKTDPITFAADRIGWYAVNVCANDIAVMGAVPKWFLATILLPERKADEELVESIFRDIASSCRDLGITLCGGHTEISYGLDRPIVVGHMLGEVRPGKLARSSNARPGDRLLLTKGIAVEGTAILAREKRSELRGRVQEESLDRASAFLDDPGISVVREALLLGERCNRIAMHDPTEGGLATALRELATAAGVGLLVEYDTVPVFPETRELCGVFGLDPWGLISSGALLAAVPPDEAESAAQAVRASGIACVDIGEVRESRFGLKMVSQGKTVDLPAFDADELGKVFGPNP